MNKMYYGIWNMKEKWYGAWILFIFGSNLIMKIKWIIFNGWWMYNWFLGLWWGGNFRNNLLLIYFIFILFIKRSLR